MLADAIRKQMVEAMKAKQTVRKDILKTTLGELQTAEARSGAKLDDDEAQKVVKKLIKSIDEALDVVSEASARAKLEEEKAVLEALLPKQLSVDEIVAALEPVRAQIEAAKADGPATGIAMKHLKAQGANVDGKDVGSAVKRIRGS